MGVHYLDDGNDDGTVLGQASTSLIGFYGVDPVDQPATVAGDATDAATASTQVNQVVARLKELGLIANA